MSGELTDDDRMTFGQYKGKRLADVPPLYFDWLRDQAWARQKFPGLVAYIEKHEARIDKAIEEGRG